MVLDRPAVVEWYGGTGVRCCPAGDGGYYRPTARGNIGGNSGYCGGGFVVIIVNIVHLLGRAIHTC